MSDEDEVFEHVDDSRRSFMRKLVVGATFATPVVSSFDMRSLSLNAAAAGPNQTSP